MQARQSVFDEARGGPPAATQAAAKPVSPEAAAKPPPPITAPATRNPAAAAIPLSPVREVKKEGYLEKKSPALLKGWQKRWFELRDNGIRYYKNKGDPMCAGEINLSDASWQWTPQNPLLLSIDIPGRKYELRASSVDEASAWNAALGERLQHALASGKKKGLFETFRE